MGGVCAGLCICHDVFGVFKVSRAPALHCSLTVHRDRVQNWEELAEHWAAILSRP